MEPIADDFSSCTALVADGNANSRAVLVAQLRALGINHIVQCIRTADARRRLEVQDFDFVLCEMYFSDEQATGQALLDDLRRDHLLPFSTVFVMVTGEATYAKVAEAAESALDGYLLKPHKASQLEERLLVARARKRALQSIFDAIGEQDFERAADMCVNRFHQRSHFWLYAGRVGAELLMRLGRHAQAQALYQIMLETESLAWARLGVARTHLERGELHLACEAAQSLLKDEPDYAEALDLLGRAQFESGHFASALDTFVHASEITPASISRLQSAGMMHFFCGEAEAAAPFLERATRLGMESKLFDPQVLVLLAIVRLTQEDRRGLQRCAEDMARMVAREPENARLQRLAHCITLCGFLFSGDADSAHGVASHVAMEMMEPGFDFESAADFIALLTTMRIRQMYVKEAEDWLHTLAMRFCSSRPFTDMLCACAQAHPPYQERIRDAHSRIQTHAEAAMMLAHQGQVAGAVASLLDHARLSLNARLIENADQLLRKHARTIPDAGALKDRLQTLRQQAGAGNRKLSLGRPGRQPGGMVLRSGARAKAAPMHFAPGPASAMPYPSPASADLFPGHAFHVGQTPGRMDPDE